MKIGIVAPIWLKIPPDKYGGTEDVVYNLTEGLVKKGHDVTVFGTEACRVSAKIIATIKEPLIESGLGWDHPQSLNAHLYHYLEAFKAAKDFDILHLHINKGFDIPGLFLAIHTGIPVISTLHFPAPTVNFRSGSYAVLSQFARLPFVSISNAARSGNNWNFVRTVYNAINIEQLPYSNASDDYFAWIGKALPVKGLKEAIHVAKKAGVRLKIMAAVDKANPESVRYFEDEVKPLIDGKQIEFLGEADVKMKATVLGKAKAMLNPIQWPEPFGLVMAEAQAVGTPVIVLNKGAASELVVDGTTGFVVDDLDEMVEKIKVIDRIDRRACRKHVEETFSIESMIVGYEKAYDTVIENWKQYQKEQHQLLPL